MAQETPEPRRRRDETPRPSKASPSQPLSDGSINIPGWAGKVVMGVLQGVMLTGLLATITWAWNMESRVSGQEFSLHQLDSRLTAAEAKVESIDETVDQHDKELAVLKSELTHIRIGVDEIKELLKQ